METSIRGDGEFLARIPFEQFVKQVIFRSFSNIKELAEKNQTCKRKGIGCTILEIRPESDLITHYTAINGLSGEGAECKNIIGACGCAHAEPRAIMKFLKHKNRNASRGKTILLTTYSPCINCANIILDSGIIDIVIYEIIAEHWAREPNDAISKLQKSNVRLQNMQRLQEDSDCNLILNLLA